MINFVTGLIGLVTVLVFLGIMMWWTQALPLMVIVIVAVVADFMIRDFLQSPRAEGQGGQR